MKLNPTAQAAKIVMLPELSEVERAAMEKIPLKDAMRDLEQQAQAELDVALLQAVEKFLGHPLTSGEQVKGRLHHAATLNEPGTTYWMDGVPVLWAGPLQTVRNGDVMCATRSMRQLV